MNFDGGQFNAGRFNAGRFSGRAAVVFAPIISSFSTAGAPDSMSMTVSVDATVYWLLDASATRTAAQIIAGGGQGSGSQAVTAGTVNIALDFSGVADGTWYLHIVADNGASSNVINQQIELLSGPSTIVFDASTWISFGGDFAGNQTEGIYAFRFRKKLAGGVGDTALLNSGSGTADSYLRIWDGSSDRLYCRLENSIGQTLAAFSGDTVSTDEERSVFIRVSSGSVEMVVDGTRVGTIVTDTYSAFKSLEFLNTSDGVGGGAVALELIGGVWISHAAGVADASTGLVYTDMFDALNVPIFGAGAVGGFAPDVALKTAADVNTYAGTTGTVT